VGDRGEQYEQARPRPDAIATRTAKSATSRQYLVGTLRKIYGKGFAAGYPETTELSEVLLQLNETSLSQTAP